MSNDLSEANQNSYFFSQDGLCEEASELIDSLKEYSESNYVQIYVLNKPLGDNKYKYDFNEGIVVLIPKHKVMILNFGDEDEFEEYVEDFLEDLGSISDKFEYKNIIGRLRKWKEDLVSDYSDFISVYNSFDDLEEFLESNFLENPLDQKKSELLISLVTGSINDVDKVKEGLPVNLLEKIKQKILLFDGDQTRFVYHDIKSKRVTIQGLSGTGKTELLLHKLKELYVGDDNAKIMFTCHNKILAASLRHRIPSFFNFMKVEKQIEWDHRLWCVHAWGSANDSNSGAYAYICKKYGLTFQRFAYSRPFSKVCRDAIEELSKRESFEYAFDYIMLDESQDFPKEFVELCQMVTRKTLYVAGDIFQSIFDETILSEVKPDFLLSKCYRTDPRTLMFAHGLGMGLFEPVKQRWLMDEEWEACGYKVTKLENGKKYRLGRIPLRRFEDLESEKTQSMNLIKSNKIQDVVIGIIQNIKLKNPTVCPGDIGIVFTGAKVDYQIADILEVNIRNFFGWSVNKGYESKDNTDSDAVFISNKNNVKGLEFPFVICVVGHISDAPHERNALYMLLTRSFIQSYLIVPENNNEEEKIKFFNLEQGLEQINREGFIETEVPSTKEQDAIRTRISYNKKNTTIHQLSINIFDELDIPSELRQLFLPLIKKLNKKNLDYETIKNFVISSLENFEEQ